MKQNAIRLVIALAVITSLLGLAGATNTAGPTISTSVTTATAINSCSLSTTSSTSLSFGTVAFGLVSAPQSVILQNTGTSTSTQMAVSGELLLQDSSPQSTAKGGGVPGSWDQYSIASSSYAVVPTSVTDTGTAVTTAAPVTVSFESAPVVPSGYTASELEGWNPWTSTISVSSSC